MKNTAKYLALLIISILFTTTISSCSKNTLGGTSSHTASVSPVAPKYVPVRKKYIINNKRRPILGVERK